MHRGPTWEYYFEEDSESSRSESDSQHQCFSNVKDGESVDQLSHIIALISTVPNEDSMSSDINILSEKMGLSELDDDDINDDISVTDGTCFSDRWDMFHGTVSAESVNLSGFSRPKEASIQTLWSPLSAKEVRQKAEQGGCDQGNISEKYG